MMAEPRRRWGGKSRLEARHPRRSACHHGRTGPGQSRLVIDDAKCFALVRQHRWPEGVRCPGMRQRHRGPRRLRRHAKPHRQRYRCKACAGRFDDLTGTVLAGHHQPLRVWVLCLYFMGLNLSNRQIAQELGLAGSDVQAMTEQLRRGLVAKIAPRASWRARWRSTRSTSWPGTRANPRRWQKGAARAPPQAGGSAGTRHAGEGQAADPRPDPARRAGGAAHAGQCAAEDDPADHRGRRRQGHPSSTPTSTTSTPACRPGAIGTRRSATVAAARQLSTSHPPHQLRGCSNPAGRAGVVEEISLLPGGWPDTSVGSCLRGDEPWPA